MLLLIGSHIQINAFHSEQKEIGLGTKEAKIKFMVHNYTYMYCGMPKGTTWAEVMSSSDGQLGCIFVYRLNYGLNVHEDVASFLIFIIFFH